MGTMLLLLLVLSIGDQTAAVKVLVLQEDGVMTNNSWAQSTVTAPRTPSASACIRFKVFFFRPLTHVFSLTSREQTREINGEIFVDYVRPIVSAAFYFLGITEPLQVLTWYHYCLTYDHTLAHISAYLDGELQGVISRNTTRWFAEATLVLGQYSIEYLDAYTKTRSFSGQLTHAGVWSRTLSPEEITELASCGPDPPGLTIPWDHEWILNNASFIDLPEDEICEKKTNSLYIKFSSMPYEAARKACAGLGGYLPVPQSLDHAYELIRVMYEEPVMTLIWIGATDELQEGFYINAHTGKELEWFEWGSNDPNGLQWQNCLVFESDFLHDYPCHVSRTAMCFLPTQRKWTLRGPCEEDTANYKYSLLHPEQGKVEFRGYYQYEIVEEDESWVWRNVITDEVIARLPFEEDRWPMGRRNWTMKSEVCEKKGTQLLQLSSCTTSEFTCMDGSCVSRLRRCDRRPDCLDESDEQDCQLVHRPIGYHHTLPPPSNVTGSPLTVGLKMKLVSLSLSDKDSYLEVTYHLNMTWSDLRLLFHNLKSASRLNQVPVGEHSRLWTPTLTLVNVRGTERTMVDDEAVLTIHRKGQPLDDDLSMPEDVNVYLGIENHLSVERKYTSQFLCDLNLHLYPFDVQRCFMDLEVLSAATDFVVLENNSSQVSYVGAKLLIEYTVVSVALQINNNKTLAEAEVEVLLQRRVGYPIISIYVPTVILLILAYLSLIFRRNNFEARVMSALTVLLVLAALFTQTSTSLPKTSYFKMVDVWLLFSISLIFFVIVFHVIIDMASEGKFISMSSRSLSPVKVAPVGEVIPVVSKDAPGHLPSIISRWPLSIDGDTDEEKSKKLSDKLFRQALIFIPCYFSAFNFIYWLYIFA
ncbi:uncharacterized protein LOC121854377 [Homarus americanus]|uniref:uncharacterized protein LOC121854377 n=1 Tax=Homarus americanus TaxID=6706 RepID=UPI001C462856|nr:uncharacterized protein LOC121854377 [Homarus americanus]